jgi:hypothetical protein
MEFIKTYNYEAYNDNFDFIGEVKCDTYENINKVTGFENAIYFLRTDYVTGKKRFERIGSKGLNYVKYDVLMKIKQKGGMICRTNIRDMHFFLNTTNVALSQWVGRKNYATIYDFKTLIKLVKTSKEYKIITADINDGCFYDSDVLSFYSYE